MPAAFPKRLSVFENLTTAPQNLTRNLRVSGLASESELDLNFFFSEFGALHVVDTQEVSQGTVLASFFDLRSAERAYHALSNHYEVSCVVDPVDSEYIDYIVLRTEPLTESFTSRLRSLIRQIKTMGDYTVLWFYDRRSAWKVQSWLLTHCAESSHVQIDITRAILIEEPKEPDYSIGLHRADRRTTVMIRNIPNKFNSQALAQCVDESFAGTYDFLYLPVDPKSKCNVGYAFINFKAPAHVLQFTSEFQGAKWLKCRSAKVCGLAYARSKSASAGAVTLSLYNHGRYLVTFTQFACENLYLGTGNTGTLRLLY